MNKKAKRMISLITTVGILSALLAGCGGEEVIEVIQTETQTAQEMPNGMLPPEMQADEADVIQMVEAALNVVVEEDSLWHIEEIADTEVLMELVQGQGGGERPGGEAFPSELPENMTPPDGDFSERPDGELPEMPEWNGENPPENMEGTFPEGEKPKAGRQPGNRGGMPGMAIVIAKAKGAAVSVEDVLAAIEAIAETLGYSTMSLEITEEQTDLLEIPEGYTGSRIVLINAQMTEMETWEPAG